jgi:hypothetical protein
MIPSEDRSRRDDHQDIVEDAKKRERERILTIIELDLLVSPEVKERLRVLAIGGYENDKR